MGIPGRAFPVAKLPKNDVLCVEWDVKLYTLTHYYGVVHTHTGLAMLSVGTLWWSSLILTTVAATRPV